MVLRKQKEGEEEEEQDEMRGWYLGNSKREKERRSKMKGGDGTEETVRGRRRGGAR